MQDGYAVTVLKNGEPILVIGSESYSGLSEFTAEDEQAIRDAGKHLLAFIGAGEPRKCFICGGLDQCESGCPAKGLHP